MDLTNLKQRLRDIPGIDRLTMLNLVGRQVFSLNGLIVALDPNATVEAAEQEIRKAVDSRLPAVSYQTASEPEKPLSDSPKPVQVLSAEPIRSVTVSFTGYEPGSIRSALEEIRRHARDTRQQAIEAVKLAGQKHQEVNNQLHEIAAMIKKDAEDALQEFATTSNGGPL